MPQAALWCRNSTITACSFFESFLFVHLGNLLVAGLELYSGLVEFKEGCQSVQNLVPQGVLRNLPIKRLLLQVELLNLKSVKLNS